MHEDSGANGVSDETERIHYNRPYVASRGHMDDLAKRYEAEGDVAIENVAIDSRPPWNFFDTFLRRAAMMGAVVLLWTVIVVGLLAVVGAGWVAHRFGDTSTVQNYQPDPCEIDPQTDGC